MLSVVKRLVERKKIVTEINFNLRFAADGAFVSHDETASFCHVGCGATAEKPPPVVMIAPSIILAACSASILIPSDDLNIVAPTLVT